MTERARCSSATCGEVQFEGWTRPECYWCGAPIAKDVPAPPRVVVNPLTATATVTTAQGMVLVTPVCEACGEPSPNGCIVSQGTSYCVRCFGSGRGR